MTLLDERVTTSAPQRRRGSLARSQSLPPAGFLLPNLVLISVFLLLPLVLAFVDQLREAGSLGPGEYLGINNYADLLRDRVFWETLKNTGVFTLFSIPVGDGAPGSASPSCSTACCRGERCSGRSSSCRW